MTNKIALIVDSNLTYLDNQVNSLANKWGYNSAHIVESEYWTDGITHQSNLFDEPSVLHLNLRKNTNTKKFTDLIKKDKLHNDWYGNGVIITATDSRGIKPIEKLIANENGIILLKRKPEEVARDLVDELTVKPYIKSQLLSYVGQDYDLLLGLVNNISKLSTTEQKELTVEQVFLQLPFKAGEVPPWEFINPLFQSDTETAIDKMTRSMQRSHALVSLSILSREIDKLYKYTILNNYNISNNDKINYLGLKNKYGLISINKIKKLPNTSVVEYLVYLVAMAEYDFKNGLVFNIEYYMRNLLTKISLSLKHNKIFEKIKV